MSEFWDRNGMTIISMTVGLIIYLVGLFIEEPGARETGVAVMGTGAGMKLDGVWSRKNILAQ